MNVCIYVCSTPTLYHKYIIKEPHNINITIFQDVLLCSLEKTTASSFLIGAYCVTSQKTLILKITTVRISDLSNIIGMSLCQGLCQAWIFTLVLQRFSLRSCPCTIFLLCWTVLVLTWKWSPLLLLCYESVQISLQTGTHYEAKITEQATTFKYSL